jgi:Holliday junction resolvasome RuvABC DNA-binding subunit
MLRAGSITVAQATTWLKHQGLSDTAVSAYVADASQQKLQGTKDLTQTTIIDLYLDRLIPKTQAATDLVNLGYTAAEANYILAVADARITQRFLGSAVGRIHSRYVAWRIDKPTAQSALQGLNVDSTGISDLLGLWDIERTANTPQLSAAQIAKAYKNNILDRPTTYARLEQLGYSKQEAWLYVSQYLDAKDQAGPP